MICSTTGILRVLAQEMGPRSLRRVRGHQEQQWQRSGPSVDGSYNGEWKNDQADGTGSNIYDDGRRYEGGWTKGDQDGEGRLFGPDGKLIYGGHWTNGEKNGQGVFNGRAGLFYRGAWSRGPPQRNRLSPRPGRRLRIRWRPQGWLPRGLGWVNYPTTSRVVSVLGRFGRQADSVSGVVVYRGGRVYIGQVVGGRPEGQGTESISVVR